MQDEPTDGPTVTVTGVHQRSMDRDGTVYEDGVAIGCQPPCVVHRYAPGGHVCRRCYQPIETDSTPTTRPRRCPRCGRAGASMDWKDGHYCPHCLIPATAQVPPSVRGHWCDGLRDLQQGVHAGTPRLTVNGTLISVGDEYTDDENPTPIRFCPMCGLLLAQ